MESKEKSKQAIYRCNFLDEDGNVSEEIMFAEFPKMDEGIFKEIKIGWKRKIDKHIQDHHELPKKDIQDIQNSLKELLSAYDEWYENKNEGMMKKEMAKEKLEKMLKKDESGEFTEKSLHNRKN